MLKLLLLILVQIKQFPQNVFTFSTNNRQTRDLSRMYPAPCSMTAGINTTPSYLDKVGIENGWMTFHSFVNSLEEAQFSFPQAPTLRSTGSLGRFIGSRRKLSDMSVVCMFAVQASHIY